MNVVTSTTRFVAGWAFCCCAASFAQGMTSSATADESDENQIRQQLLRRLESNPAPTEETVASVNVWSRRGDALFFLERFEESVAAYEKMIQVDPATKASHWRLGIAYFFNNQPAKAVQIFEGYHSYDNVDRENGIWRFLSQWKATDAKTAEKELLKYEKDDREPFPAVYQLFSGKMTIAQVVDSVPADLSPAAKEQREFYIRLYCGMLSVVRDQPAQAITHLRKATEYKWPRSAGYGPNYMWHVARVQLALLTKKRPKENVSRDH